MLFKGGKIAQSYMQRHAVPTASIATVVSELVHTCSPPRRLVINMSLEMHAAAYTPQRILDAAVKWLFA